MTTGDFFVSRSREVDPFLHEVAVMKQLIQERSHPLELLRELISNSGAHEVGSSEIRITYFVHPEYGHTFEVSDDGCGMNFTDSSQLPGRLDRFLGLGLSSVAGLEADEFAWKGLGSKLAYQSRRIEIETFNGNVAYASIVNEPWETIEEGRKPKPTVSELGSEKGMTTGTKVKVYGHPPHRKGDPFTFEEIRDYLTHRTFVGLTKDREAPPKVILTVQNRTEALEFGWPEFRRLPKEVPQGTVVLDPEIVVSKNVPGTNENVHLVLKGFYTWDDNDYGLDNVRYNTGMILSVKGIPYFGLDMRELGSGQLAVANPGVGKYCLVVECDAIHTVMNISRTGLVDSALTEHFKRLVGEAIVQVEDTQRHRDFRQVPKRRKEKTSAKELKSRKEELESPDQRWVYWAGEERGTEPLRLLREPMNETDTLAVLWKLEALGALPFTTFETLAYSGRGADLIVHFQEDESANSERFATFEAEYRFYNFKAHGHLIPQFPTVICWEVNPKPKLSVKKTGKGFKHVVQLEETTLRIFALKDMPGIFTANDEEFKRKKATEAWGENL